MPTTNLHGACRDVAAVLPVARNCAKLRRLLEVLLPYLHSQHGVVLCTVGAFPTWVAQEEVRHGSNPTDMQGAAQLEIAEEVGCLL